MKLYLCIVTMTPKLLEEAATIAASNAVGEIELVVLANGCGPCGTGLPFAKVHVVDMPTNIGVTRGLDEIYRWVSGVGGENHPQDDILCYIHDDLHILEPGWDDRVRRVFETMPDVGVAGFAGAQGLGQPEWIYQDRYHPWQMTRQHFRSNMVDAEVHGDRWSEEQPIGTLDGLSLICRRSFLDKIGGFSWWPLPHHGYDNALCCMARRHGQKAWLIPVLVHHNGGQTAGKPAWQDFAAREYGSDDRLQQRATKLVYDMFRDVLPIKTEWP